MRNTMKKGMLGAILGAGLVAGLLGTGAVAANAAQWGERGVGHGYGDRGFDRHYDRGHERVEYRGFYGQRTYGTVVENYIPPCPGEGYEWIAGYYNGGYWVPGSWVLRDRGYGYVGGYGFDRDRHYDRNEWRDDHRRDDRGWNRGDGRIREGGFNRGGRPQR